MTYHRGVAGAPRPGRRISRMVAALSVIALTALAWVVAAPSVAWAQADDAQVARITERLDYFDSSARAVDAMLASEVAEPAALGLLRETMSDHRTEARALAEQVAANLEPLKAQLEALGPAPEGDATEATDIQIKRAALSEQIAETEGRLKRAELAATRADSLLSALAKRQRDLVTQKLLARGSVITDVNAWLASLNEAQRLTGNFTDGAIAAVDKLGWLTTLGAFLGVVAVILFLYATPRGRIGQLVDYLVQAAKDARSHASKIFYGTCLVLLRVAPVAIATLVLAGVALEFADLGAPGRLLVNRLVEGVLIVLVTSAIARIIFAPRLSTERVIRLEDRDAARAWSQIVVLAALICAGRAVLDAAEAAGAQIEFLAIVNFAVAVLSAPIIFSLARLICRPITIQGDVEQNETTDADDDADANDDRGVAATLASVGQLAGMLVALLAPAAAALGYYALSRFMLERAALTGALLLGLVLAFVIVKRLLQGAVDTVEPTEAGEAPAASSKRMLGLAPAITGFLLAIVAAPLLAGIWGASAADLRVLAVDLIDGVEIGDATYSIVDVLAAIGVFVVGLWITRLLQRLLRRDVLPNTSLDAGVKTSLSAGLGYVGFFITTLIAISAAGLDLSNLAIVAGALSVGIGFGLQNVVNNFVSGLILLVERPIKVGDWIVVGGNQGYVRRINVRSTEIETFDRSSVIVPNSELISSAVTNWTHKNVTGRVIASVGVGYDSDSEEVTRILREIGTAHPLAVRYPKPFVYFAGFGDSALNFELRVMIRDVNNMLSVHHDLNLAIHKRFREEGIEIPFPQRDLNIKTGALSNGHAGGALSSGSPGASSGDWRGSTDDVAAATAGS